MEGERERDEARMGSEREWDRERESKKKKNKQNSSDRTFDLLPYKLF